MSNKSKKTELNYLQLISKSTEDIQNELLILEVEKAANVLEQGILSVKSDMLDKESALKSTEIAIADKERNLENSLSIRPFNVETILNARVAVLNAQNDIIEAKESLAVIKSHYDYLLSLQKRLFNA